MQRVDLKFYEGPLHCPFCGKETIGEAKVSSCKHTLFVAVDEGLEYCSKQIERDILEKEAETDGWDKATDKFSYPESVKFAIYQAPPSFMGQYIGYAPK